MSAATVQQALPPPHGRSNNAKHDVQPDPRAHDSFLANASGLAPVNLIVRPMPVWTALVEQALVGFIMFFLFRRVGLFIYLVFWPLFWIVPGIAVSAAHCGDCGKGIWYWPLLYLFVASFMKLGSISRAADEARQESLPRHDGGSH